MAILEEVWRTEIGDGTWDLETRRNCLNWGSCNDNERTRGTGELTEQSRERGEVVFQVCFGLEVLLCLVPFALSGTMERRADLEKRRLINLALDVLDWSGLWNVQAACGDNIPELQRPLAWSRGSWFWVKPLWTNDLGKRGWTWISLIK